MLCGCLTFKYAHKYSTVSHTHTATGFAHTPTASSSAYVCVLRALARVVVAAAAAAAFHCSCAAWPPQVFCHFYLCFYISTLPQLTVSQPGSPVASTLSVAGDVVVIVRARFVWLLNITLDNRPCWVGNKHAHVQHNGAALLLFIYLYK